MLGKFNIDNLSQAFAIASELGINPDEIPLALKNAIGAPGRMEKYDLTMVRLRLSTMLILLMHLKSIAIIKRSPSFKQYEWENYLRLWLRW